MKAGEEMRITLFNPQTVPIEVRVFAYNSADNTYDEGPKVMLAPGRMRFFDIKATRDFIGLGGVIEQTPDAAPSVATASKDAKPALMLTDLMVSSVISRGSLQHRSSTGQTQTMGYSFGATQTNGGWFRTIQTQSRRIAKTEWQTSVD